MWLGGSIEREKGSGPSMDPCGTPQWRMNSHELRTEMSWLVPPCFSLQKKVVQAKTRVCFVLLSAPWSVLCYYAEEINLRVPLQVNTSSSSAAGTQIGVLAWFHLCPLSSCRWSTLRTLPGLNRCCPGCPSPTLCSRMSPTPHPASTPVSSGPTSCRGDQKHKQTRLFYFINTAAIWRFWHSCISKYWKKLKWKEQEKPQFPFKCWYSKKLMCQSE